MAHKLSLNALLAIERLLEGKDHQHLVDVLPHQFDAVLLPGPQLRADEVDHRNAQPVQLPGQPEVNLGKINEHGHAGPPIANGLLQPRILAPDTRQMANHFGQPHDRHVFRADDALDPGSGHALAAHAEEAGGLAGCGKLLLERVGQHRSVVLAAGLACRDEDVLVPWMGLRRLTYALLTIIAG